MSCLNGGMRGDDIKRSLLGSFASVRPGHSARCRSARTLLETRGLVSARSPPLCSGSGRRFVVDKPPQAPEQPRTIAMDDIANQNVSAPWDGLLASAGPRDHIVQLYQDQEFLNRAVCRFAAGAIENGEGIILVPTAEHWEAFRPRLEAEGVDVKAAQSRGQLTVVDADELLPRFMRKSMPDAPLFLGIPKNGTGEGRS